MNPTLQSYALVALGGALGAMARMGGGHLVTTFAGTRYPWHTFAINIVGSFLLGLTVTLLGIRASPNTAALNHLLAIGFLGAFTTFSTFQLETWTLVQQGRAWAALAYVAGSIVVGLAGLIAGVAIARAIS